MYVNNAFTKSIFPKVKKQLYVYKNYFYLWLFRSMKRLEVIGLCLHLLPSTTILAGHFVYPGQNIARIPVTTIISGFGIQTRPVDHSAWNRQPRSQGLWVGRSKMVLTRRHLGSPNPETLGTKLAIPGRMTH